MLRHWQASFGASGFLHASVSVPQILGIRQKIKNFQLFYGVTKKGKSFSAWLALDTLMHLSAGYWFYTAARLSEIDLTQLSGFVLQSCQPDGIFET